MKELIIIMICIFVVIFITSRPQADIAKHLTSDDFAVVEYDSCEYVIKVEYAKGFLAHKGNCKYCEKRNKK